MSVQEQTPFIEYECNGVTKVFPLNFDCHDSDHLIVKLDDVLSAAGSWDLQNKSVVFRVAPKAKSRLTIQRNTPLERLINYSSYDNSMLPQVFNQDFDRVWYKLQEHNQQITYSLNAIDDIYSIANEALGKANQSIEDITEINKHLAKFSNSAGYVYARQVVGKDGKTQEVLNTEARPINTGGTGATTADDARTNLDVFSKAQVNALIATGGEGEIIGVSGGGTGATTAEEARTNLNVYSKGEVDKQIQGVGESASTAQKTADKKLDKTAVNNTLTSTDKDQALSAAMGKQLDDTKVKHETITSKFNAHFLNKTGVYLINTLDGENMPERTFGALTVWSNNFTDNRLRVYQEFRTDFGITYKTQWNGSIWSTWEPNYPCRAWANLNCVNVTIRNSGNVASISKLSTGKYGIVFKSPMPHANYAITISSISHALDTRVIHDYYDKTQNGFKFEIVAIKPGWNDYVDLIDISITVTC